MSIVLCEELPEPPEPWEHEPLPAVYADDYPVEDPPPSAADADRAARAWEADRIHNR